MSEFENLLNPLKQHQSDNIKAELLDPLKVHYKLEGVDKDYALDTILYTDFGLGMHKGLALDNKLLKYLFIVVQFVEPVFVPSNSKITLKYSDGKYDSLENEMCSENLKYPGKVVKFYPRFFIDNYDRFYGDNYQANYDNGNIMLKYVNLDGLYHLAFMVFRIDLTLNKQFKIEKTKEAFEATNCVACLERMCIVRLKPCDHMCLCYECYSKLCQQKCPVCNTYIQQAIV